MAPQVPGSFTRSIPATVRPRNTSSEINRSRVGLAGGAAVTRSSTKSASTGRVALMGTFLWSLANRLVVYPERLEKAAPINYGTAERRNFGWNTALRDTVTARLRHG